MKKLFVMMLVSTNAMALDFDAEWSKFAPDFAKMRKVAYVAPVIEPVKANYSLLETNSQSNVLERVDPKSPHRLGYKLKDPAMRERLTELYKRPDTVVYSLTLE